MNEAHFHLTVNHLPIIIPIVGFLILVGGMILKSDIIKRTAYAVFFLGALTTIPAFASGEGAEEIIEPMEHMINMGISHHIIHEHEEAAESFALLSYALGLLSLIALWANWKKKSIANAAQYVILVLSLAVLYTGKQTGTTGGEVRHTEIRSGSTSTNSSMEHEEHEEEHED